MPKMTVTAGSPSPIRHERGTPLTGVMIGTAISLLLWAMILAVFFAVR